MSLRYNQKDRLRRLLVRLLKLWEILGSSPLDRDQNLRQGRAKICSHRGCNLRRFSRSLLQSKHLKTLRYQAKQSLAASEVTKLLNPKTWWCNLKIPKLWQTNWSRLDTLIKLLISPEHQIAVLKVVSEILRSPPKILKDRREWTSKIEILTQEAQGKIKTMAAKMLKWDSSSYQRGTSSAMISEVSSTWRLKGLE